MTSRTHTHSIDGHRMGDPGPSTSASTHNEPSARNKVSVAQNRHAYADKPVEREVNIQVELGTETAEEREVERSLEGVPLEIQEAWICEDLLFALQVSRSLYTGLC